MSDPALLELSKRLNSATWGGILATVVVGGTIIEGMIVTHDEYIRYVETAVQSVGDSTGSRLAEPLLLPGDILYVKAPRVRVGSDTVFFSSAIMRVPVSSVAGWCLGAQKPDQPQWDSHKPPA